MSRINVRLLEPRIRDEDPVEEPTPHRKRHVLRDTFRTLEILILIAYVTLLVASRTEGFRALISRQVESRLGGGSVTIGSSKLTPGLRLVLGDLRVRWPNAQGSEIGGIETIELNPDWLGWMDGFRAREARMTGGRLIFQVTEAGAVSPGFGQDLTRWLQRLGWATPEIDPAAAGGDPELWWMLDAPVRFSGFDLHWVTARGGRHLAVEGLKGEVLPLRAERSAFRYVDLSAGRMVLENGSSLIPPPVCALLNPDQPARRHDLLAPSRPQAVGPEMSVKVPEPETEKRGEQEK
jgi:hypothetical protein